MNNNYFLDLFILYIVEVSDIILFCFRVCQSRDNDIYATVGVT